MRRSMLAISLVLLLPPSALPAGARADEAASIPALPTAGLAATAGVGSITPEGLAAGATWIPGEPGGVDGLDLTRLAADDPVPDSIPLLERPCTPVDQPPFDLTRPEACKRILYAYGPLEVTPGDNRILLGPVTIEKPLEEAYVVRFSPNLIRADGSTPPTEILHLHHAVWLSSGHGDPLFATGEEKTTFVIPNGYGLHVRPNDTWIFNYMIHNGTPVADVVFVTYELDILPAADVTGITPVQPYWVNVASFYGLNPVYNSQRGYGAAAGECAFPKEECGAFDPYGNTRAGQGQPGNGTGRVQNPPSGTVVFAVGHVHPGGLRLELDLRRGGQTRRVLVSEAVYFDPNGPISWDLAMEVTKPSYRLRINQGDQFILNSVYETERASWYEGMGIVVLFIARGDTSGPDPFVTPVDPHETAVTHGHRPENDNYGGPDRDPFPALRPLPIDTVGIKGFLYQPGDLGTAQAVGVPAVRRGEPLTFVNLDVQAAIFHTVTACRAPCNGATGISYPLANGEADFDSLQLGVGPPGVTPAANTISYTLDTSGFDDGVYTFYCRVHPFMRGAFAVEDPAA